MGGIGKTTLAKNVYNDPRIENGFKHRIWICVSKEFRPVDILQNVIREIGGVYGEAREISELVPILQQCAREKMFFLVLDDIWEESENVWRDHLRVPMSSGAPQSRVLITTRDCGVAMRMGAIHTHNVKMLSDKDGWSLLAKQVDPNGVESEIQDLIEIGLQIVKKCNGLPLAIKSIGGVLRTKDNTRSNWLSVLTNNMWSINGLPKDVHQAFYLSYEDLPPPLKQCFIFCSFFPEDFVFTKTNLIYMWFVEGFLQDMGDFWELGNNYYTELRLRNLLELAETNSGIEKCKMHDILWIFARHLGKDENCVLREGNILSTSKGLMKMRRLSIEGTKVNIEGIKKEKGLRTLLLLFKPEIALDDMCKAFSNLRILDMSSSNFLILPDSLCDLMHLRYMNVCLSKIKNLPNSIGNLKYLVYLNLERCYDLSHVPHSIINLQELKYLNTNYSGVKKIPAGLNKLDRLVELYGFEPDKDSSEGSSSIDGLEPLSQLTVLLLNGLASVYDLNIAKTANLRTKNQLRHLHLKYAEWSYEEQLCQTDENKMITENVLNELCPPCSLEYLEIGYYFGRCLPNWLNLSITLTLPNLRHLVIRKCACIEGLSLLGQLPNLNILLINGAYSVVNVGEEFLVGGIQRRDSTAMSSLTKPAFPKLNDLSFGFMDNWKEWQWNKALPAMPKVKKLALHCCLQLSSLPEGLCHHATSLDFLHIVRADKLKTIENLPSIKTIIVERCQNLERISNLVSVSRIKIKTCPNLKTVENLEALHMMELLEENRTLPDYLKTIMPQKLSISCSEELLREIATNDESGFERRKFRHIQTVEFRSYLSRPYPNAIYQRTPLS